MCRKTDFKFDLSSTYSTQRTQGESEEETGSRAQFKYALTYAYAVVSAGCEREPTFTTTQVSARARSKVIVDIAYYLYLNCAPLLPVPRARACNLDLAKTHNPL